MNHLLLCRKECDTMIRDFTILLTLILSLTFLSQCDTETIKVVVGTLFLVGLPLLMAAVLSSGSGDDSY